MIPTAPNDILLSWSPRGRAALGLAGLAFIAAGQVWRPLRVLAALLFANALMNQPVRLRLGERR
jgi:hypothetical protein